MEAGYDYLLLRGRLQRRLFNVSGIFIFVFGAMLLATSGAYYGYAAKAHADLDSLNVTLPETAAKIGAGPGSQGPVAEALVDSGQEGVYSLSTSGASEGNPLTRRLHRQSRPPELHPEARRQVHQDLR